MGGLQANFQHFHPQIVTNPDSVIGCTFYEFGPKPSTYLIDVIMARSFNGGASFNHFAVTDQPWDPAVDAPWAHHGDNTPIDSSVTFIGDYFGLDASNKGFYPLWTDARTGIQELWVDIVCKTGQKIASPPTSWQTQDGPNVAEHLAGMAPNGDLLVLYFEPRFDWQFVNVTE
jgi:hypothetical protein